MKKVLIITYYWPPSGGSGVQRWLKTARYLREYGWEPVIYTVENGEYPVLDEKLNAEVPADMEVIRRPIREPYSFYKAFLGQKKNERVVSGFLNEKARPSLKSRISTWIRGNFFIPDARKWWIRPSVRYLNEWLKTHPVDLIVSTGPPHSMHMIARGLQQKTGLPWVADFRDPWTNIDFYKDLMLTAWADRKHHRMEADVVTHASRVVVVGNSMKEEFEQIRKGPVDLIPNGYDEADLPPDRSSLVPDTAFTLVHIGMLGATRNHPALWEAVAELAQEDAAFGQAVQVVLAGKVDAAARADIERVGLSLRTQYIDYLSHPEAIRRQATAQVLLLLINDTQNAKGVLTGKLFEYLAAGRAILCIGPEDGDAAALLREAGSGETADFRNKEGMKRILRAYFTRYQAGDLAMSGSGVEAYSRRALAGRFADIFNEITA